MKRYTQIYTGNGKGKTTAALGLAVRALGNGYHVYIGQFMKGQEYGELRTFAKLDNIIIERFGTENCIISKEHVQQIDIDKAKAGLKRAKEALICGDYELVILDEICVAHVLTGRYAPQIIIDRADLVTEMKEIKHYYNIGVMARDGIER